jgi:glycosyltransferase involved in cell wall biosynthesis
MRILHIITGPLGMGGAEVMLQRLIEASDLDEATHEVVCLRQLGVVADRIRELGIKTHAMHMTRLPDPRAMLRLMRQIAEFDPDVVQTWLYHADLIGGLAAKLAGGAKIVWGIHNNALDPQGHRTTRWIMAASARLSRRVPDRIVCVSHASMNLHVAAGYARERFIVIPNGFDVGQFRPDATDRRRVREQLGVAPAEVVIGLIARTHPQKDHPSFLRAARTLAGRHAGARFLLCGEGTTAANGELVRAIAEAGLTDRVQLLGPRGDVHRIMNAVDIGALSSTSEAFPLVIGELMACGVPCVVTDVGDCAFLVGDTGLVVPARDPEALARAWEALILEGADGRRRRGLAARARIAAHFTLPRIAEAYSALYRRLLEGPRTVSGETASHTPQAGGGAETPRSGECP